jgi:hypothetical protein
VSKGGAGSIAAGGALAALSGAAAPLVADGISVRADVVEPHATSAAKALAMTVNAAQRLMWATRSADDNTSEAYHQSAARKKP